MAARCRPGLLVALGAALVLNALATSPAGAAGIGVIEATVVRLLGGKPLPTAGPTTDAHVLAYDSTTGRLVWEAQASGSGDLTEIQETGDALVVASGTGPIPSLSAHANVEGLADATVPASIAFTGSVSATTNVKGNQFVGGVTALSDLSIDFGDGAIQTKTEATNVTFTLAANGLGAGRACTVIVTSTGGGSITYPSAIATANGWAGSAPTTLAAGERLMLQLYSTSNNESGVIACATVLGAGS